MDVKANESSHHHSPVIFIAHESQVDHHEVHDSNIDTSSILIDIKRDGWDDHAIESTWNKSLAGYFALTPTTEGSISFHPTQILLQNKTRDVSSTISNRSNKGDNVSTLTTLPMNNSINKTQYDIPCPSWAIMNTLSST